MKTSEFIKEAKKFIMHAFIQPKGNSKTYTSPFFVWASVPTLPYMLKTNIEYDEEELVFWDYQKKEPYISISYSEITEFGLSVHARTAGRIHGSYYIVIRMKSELVDFEIETLDIFEVLHICKGIKEHGVVMDDPYEMIAILMAAYKKQLVYQEYMEINFSKIAEQYDIKYPVITYEREDRKISDR